MFRGEVASDAQPRGGWRTLTAELYIASTQQINVDIDAGEQRVANALLVGRDQRCGAGAVLLAVAVIAAKAGIISKRQFCPFVYGLLFNGR